MLNIQRVIQEKQGAFHAIILIAWLADEASLMCYIVMMGSLIDKMLSTFSL